MEQRRSQVYRKLCTFGEVGALNVRSRNLKVNAEEDQKPVKLFMDRGDVSSGNDA